MKRLYYQSGDTLFNLYDVVLIQKVSSSAAFFIKIDLQNGISFLLLCKSETEQDKILSEIFTALSKLE